VSSRYDPPGIPLTIIVEDPVTHVEIKRWSVNLNPLGDPEDFEILAGLGLGTELIFDL
jgi:hypothetical protein